MINGDQRAKLTTSNIPGSCQDSCFRNTGGDYIYLIKSLDMICRKKEEKKEVINSYNDTATIPGEAG